MIALISEWQDEKGTIEQRNEKSEMGGTMRLGAQEVRLSHGSRSHQIYGSDVIQERHRHRYEFNNRYLQKMMNAGLRFSGFSRDGLVEMIELPTHPFFVACQFHPEFRSTPRDGHPLFTGVRESGAGVSPGSRCRSRNPRESGRLISRLTQA